MSLLSNAEFALVPLEKLRDCSLNPEHPRGKHKARVFEFALGMTSEDAPRLRELILRAIQTSDAVEQGSNEHGTRYVVDFLALGPKGQVPIPTTWIIDVGGTFARLTSCYVTR